MIVRLHRRAINLMHLALAEDADQPYPGGMKIFLIGLIERDLGPGDADRLRRRFLAIDPEPLDGEGQGGVGDAGSGPNVGPGGDAPENITPGSVATPDPPRHPRDPPSSRPRRPPPANPAS